MLVSDPLSDAVIILGLIGALYGKGRRWNAAFCGVPVMWALGTVGYRGSGPNYFFESLSVLCVCMAVLLQSAQAISVSSRSWRRVLVCSVLILGCLGSAYGRGVSPKYFFNILDDFRKSSHPLPIVQFMEQKLPPHSIVLAECSDLPLFAGYVPAVSDPYILTMMSEKGKWDPAPVVEALRDHRIGFVMIGEKIEGERPSRFFPAEVADAIYKNYKRIGRYGDTELYMPKQ